MRVCPRCASTSVETTTVGYYGLDMNRATCRGPGCAWVGRAHEMATTEAGAEAALRELLAAMDTLATTKTAVWFGKAGTDDLDAAQERMRKATERARGVLGG